MSKKKKETPRQKEIRLLKNRIKTAEKAGYYVPDTFKIPRNTKDIKALRFNTLREKLNYIDIESGEILTGKEGRKLQYKQRELYKEFISTPIYSNSYVTQVLNLIDQIPDTTWQGEYMGNKPQLVNNEHSKQFLSGIVENSYAQNPQGYSQYLEDIEEDLASEFANLSESWYREEVDKSFSTIAFMLKMAPLSETEQTELNDISESYDDWEEYEE